jgi:hypothetical protein
MRGMNKMVTKSRFSLSGYIIRGICLFLLFQVLTFGQQPFENKLPANPDTNGLHVPVNYNDDEMNMNPDFNSDSDPENPGSVKRRNSGGESILYRPLKAILNGGTGYVYFTYNSAGSVLSKIIENNGVFTTAVLNTYDSHENKLTEINQKYISGAWANIDQSIYTYDENRNKTSIKTQSWVNNSWQNQSFRTYTYYPTGFQSVYTYYTWSNEAWVEVSRTTATYNQFNSLLTNTAESFTNGIWLLTSRSVITYDANNRVLEYITQQWSNGDWLNVDVTRKNYDEFGNLISALLQNWSGNSWVNVSRSLYTNNSSGNSISDTQQVWESGNWINRTFYGREYHQNGSVAVEIQKWWDRTLNDWENQWIWHDDYDAHDNLVFRSTGRWSDSGWVTTSKQIMSYDENDNFKTHVKQSFSNGGWLTNYTKEYSYDVSGNCIYASVFDGNWLPIYENLYLWYNNKSTLISFNAKSVEVQYLTFTDIKGENEILNTFALSQNYPNPFNPETVIRFSIPETGFVKGVVYDILGREVTTLLNGEMNPGNHQVKFDAKGIASGVYIFRIEAGKYSSAIKMVVGK